MLDASLLAKILHEPSPLLAAAPTPVDPQAALRVYERLCDQRLGSVPAGCWRDCADRLEHAAAEVPAAYRAKYIDRAVNCRASAADWDATECRTVRS
jgi:hypothetical protein